MVRVTTPAGSFCLDTLETSQADYGAFLAANLPTQGQPEMCQFNASWVPPVPDIMHDKSCQPGGWDPATNTGPADLPMGCVDWCDARAYCAWAGKRLCGKVGGGTMSQEDKKTVTTSELGYACSQAGKTTYPYGNAADEKACELGLAGQEPRAKLGSTGCRGQSEPYAQVYDLVGNVDEWEDGALYLPDGDSDDFRWGYPVRASTVSRGDSEAVTSCAGTAYYGGGSPVLGVGIRCCAD